MNMQPSPPQVVFITGVSSGIGYATALAFLQQGDHVAGTARDVQRLQALQAAAEQLPTPRGEFLPLAADVRDAASIAHALHTAYNHFGALNVLIANAGVGHKGSVVESEWGDVETLLTTNINGVLHTLRAGVPLLQRQRGHVVMLSSVTYNMTVPYASFYAATKAFVSSIARALRLELEREGICVTEMVVGRTATAFNENRLGGKRSGDSVSSMPPQKVALRIVQAVQQRNNRAVFVRFFDRLTVWGSIFFTERIGRIALKDYK